MPVLVTERLILRPPEAADFEGWAEVMGDPETSRHIGGPLSRGGAWRSLAVMAGSWALYGFGNFSVLDKATGQWLGRVGPWHPDPWPGPEIGWVLRRSAWGHGFATEAAVAATDWVVATLGWTNMVHVIHPENDASMKVARRLGSTELAKADVTMFEAPKPRVFGQSLSDWTARRKDSAPKS